MTPSGDLGSCLYCGRPAEEGHHFSASLASQTAYLDSEARIPLCTRCHHTEHTCWREVGLDLIDDPLFARLRRTTWTLGRLADLAHPVTLDSLTLRGLHLVLLRIGEGVAALVEGLP